MQRGARPAAALLNAGERFADDVKRRAADGGVRKRAESDQAATQMIAADRRRKLEALAKWYYKVPKARKNAPLLVQRAARRAAAHNARGRAVRRDAHLSEAVSAHQGHVVASQSAARTAMARQHMKQHVSLEAARAAQVYQFLESAGWLHSPDQLTQLKQEALRQIAAARLKRKAAADAAAAAATAAAASCGRHKT
jgi:hypothetical protein